MESGMKLLDHLEEWLIAFLIGGATLLIFVAVLHRHLSAMSIPVLQDWLLGLNFSWAQELCIIMFVWMAKFGAAYGVRTGIHVGDDVVINRMEEKRRAKFVLFGLLAGALFTGAVAMLGARFIWDNGMHYATLHFLGMDPGPERAGPVPRRRARGEWPRIPTVKPQ